MSACGVSKSTVTCCWHLSNSAGKDYYCSFPAEMAPGENKCWNGTTFSSWGSGQVQTSVIRCVVHLFFCASDYPTLDKVLVRIQRRCQISRASAKLLFGYYWSLWAFVTEKTEGDGRSWGKSRTLRHRYLLEKCGHRCRWRRFDRLGWRRVWWTVIS